MNNLQALENLGHCLANLAASMTQDLLSSPSSLTDEHAIHDQVIKSPAFSQIYRDMQDTLVDSDLGRPFRDALWYTLPDIASITIQQSIRETLLENKNLTANFHIPRDTIETVIQFDEQGSNTTPECATSSPSWSYTGTQHENLSALQLPAVNDSR